MSNYYPIIDMIEIKAFPMHQESESVEGANFVFTYTMFITNNSQHTIQLLGRKWQVFDGFDMIREVEGPGVIGQQPIIGPDEQFDYQSWCPINQDFGLMNGCYYFKNLDTGEEFKIEIPGFILQPNFKLN